MSMDENEFDIDWEDLAATAMAMDSRRQGMQLLLRMYTTDAGDFVRWLKHVDPDDHVRMILSLLTASEFLVEAHAAHLNTSGEKLLTCLAELAENG